METSLLYSLAIVTLPIEVIEHIIDMCSVRDHSTKHTTELLVEDPRKTLMACALICRAWLPRSRHNLFRRVELSESPSSYGVPNVEIFLRAL